MLTLNPAYTGSPSGGHDAMREPILPIITEVLGDFRAWVREAAWPDLILPAMKSHGPGGGTVPGPLGLSLCVNIDPVPTTSDILAFLTRINATQS